MTLFSKSAWMVAAPTGLLLALSIVGCSTSEGDYAELEHLADDALYEIAHDEYHTEIEPFPAFEDEIAYSDLSAPLIDEAIIVETAVKSVEYENSAVFVDAGPSSIIDPTVILTDTSTIAPTVVSAPIIEAGLPLLTPTVINPNKLVIDSLNVDPENRHSCFLHIDREFYNRCNFGIRVKTCLGQSCHTYDMPALTDVQVPHPFDSVIALGTVHVPESLANEEVFEQPIEEVQAAKNATPRIIQ